MEKRNNDFLKKCYVICRNVDWNKTLIEEEALKLNITYEQLVDYAREYINSGFPDWYSDLENITLTNYGNKGLTVHLLKVYGDKIPHYDGSMKMLQKHCYNMALSVDFNEDKMQKQAEYLGLSFSSFLRKVRQYAHENNVGEDFENKIESFRNAKRRKEYLASHQDLVRLVSALTEVDLSDEEKIVQLCENSNLDVNIELIHRIPFCIENLYPNDDGTKRDDIKRKLYIYRAHANDNSRRERLANLREEKARLLETLLPEAIQCVSMFIASDCETVRTFVNLNHISYNSFNVMVECLRLHNQELYEKYLRKVNGDKSVRYAMIVENIKRMTVEIKKGIDGRNFDIIDYYRYTNIPFSDLIKITNGKLNGEEVRLLKIFITKYNNIKPLSENEIQYILNENIEVECQTDKKGNIIKGTGRVITRSEKEKIMEYVTSLGIPLSKASYRSAFDRYVKGYLDLQERDTIHK